MIRSLFILAQLLLLGIAAVGQTITFTIKESPIPMAFIYVNHGNNTEKVDSAAIQANGKYVFRVNPKNYCWGIHAFAAGQRRNSVFILW